MTNEELQKKLPYILYKIFLDEGGDAYMSDFDKPEWVVLDGTFDFVRIAELLSQRLKVTL